ncbi:MAG: LysR family transcriptional regulator [Eubacteriales bacterium]|nr:LysR family transcriptional regulator [Eubacteriales bacterium]
MNLSQLYYFQKLAEIQHYSTAAKELHISQPALSSAISSLESELYVPLFQKCGRNVKLTDYGKEFYSYVTKSLRYIEQGSAIMQEYSNHISGTISIGCIPTLLNDYLPGIIHDYQEKYESSNFEVFHGMSKDVVEGVLSKKYDIGICSKIDDIPDLVFVPISYQEIITICRDDDKSIIGDSIPISYLKGRDDIITYRTNIQIGKTISSVLKKNNIDATQKYDDEISIAGIISKFGGFGVCANTSFLDQFNNIRRLHISDLPLSTRLIYMCYNKTALHPSIVESFMNFIVINKLNLPE